ncbi:MAG: serine/threonine protein kinase [Candidatus Dormibacteria bacterium]
MRVDELTGTTVSRYRVGGRVQVLPYAAVHRANVMADGRPVLLWSFREPYSGAMGFLEALQQLAGDRRVEGIAGIAPALEIGAQEAPFPIAYLVSEDAPRGFLVSLLQTGRAPGVIATASALARGLDNLHAQGLVHGDVQPATVAVDAGNHPVLVGYGIRTVVRRVTPQAAWIDMTRGFRPPEAGSGPMPTRADDLYGLAALIYYLLVGRPPATDQTPEPPSRLRPQLPPTVDRAILRALSRDPRERFSSGSELVAALKGTPTPAVGAGPAAATAPGAATSAAPTPRPPTPPPPATALPNPVESAPGATQPSPADRSLPITPPAAEPVWSAQASGGLGRSASTMISMVPLEPYEMEPEIRRRSGIVLLLALIVVALLLLVLAASGRLYL